MKTIKMTDDIKKNICPNCQESFLYNQTNKASIPFCTKRCKMIDLGRWLGEKYSVAGPMESMDIVSSKDGEDFYYE